MVSSGLKVKPNTVFKLVSKGSRSCAHTSFRLADLLFSLLQNLDLSTLQAKSSLTLIAAILTDRPSNNNHGATFQMMEAFDSNPQDWGMVNINTQLTSASTPTTTMPYSWLLVAQTDLSSPWLLTELVDINWERVLYSRSSLSP